MRGTHRIRKVNLNKSRPAVQIKPADVSKNRRSLEALAEPDNLGGWRDRAAGSQG
jgi:hypothetical protein